MTIDGTDYRIQQKGVAKKGNLFGSHKYGGKSALRYELGIDILAGNLVWVSGPYPAGRWTDVKIFDDVLSNLLEPGERVEADNGYVGRADKVNVQTTTATHPRIWGCRGKPGHAMKHSTAASRIGASSRRCTGTTLPCTVRSFMRAR